MEKYISIVPCSLSIPEEENTHFWLYAHWAIRTVCGSLGPLERGVLGHSSVRLQHGTHQCSVITNFAQAWYSNGMMCTFLFIRDYLG